MVDKREYLRHLTVELDKQFPDNRRINFVIHGHSQTCGYTVGHVVDPFAAYPHRFHKLIKHRFPFAVTNVIVTGIGGECAINGDIRFEQDVLCHKPDVIAIDYALNDRTKDPVRTKAAWESMVDKAAARGIPVLLMTPTHDYPSAYEPEKQQKLRDLEIMITEIGERKNVGVVQVMQAWDKYLLTGNIEDLLTGANHSSKLAHEITARELHSWIPNRGYTN